MRFIKFLTILLFLAFLIAENIHANEYIAFSIKVAQQMILSTPQGKDYRKLHPEVFTLGGITAMNGLVYDRKTGDVILVGQRDPDRAILTLDDFVVALRARFIHGKWPLVSIDPTPETEKTQMQVVRFEGGIEDTQFGQDLFDADYCLKRISLGLLPSGVPGVKTGWDWDMERMKQQPSKSYRIVSRFWFYPVIPYVSVKEDIVAIKGLKVGVFTQVMSAEIDGKKIEDPKNFQDTAGDEFAKQVTDKFEALSKVHPFFSRVQCLDELIALVNAIENMDERPDLDWWLMKYQMKRVKTEKVLKVLRRDERYLRVEGGVQLMAIALRLQKGDVTALKEAVLKTRPRLDALSWGFVVGEWLIPTTMDMLKREDLTLLFTQAVFLQVEQERYNDAIALYGKVIELKPDWNSPYILRGFAYLSKGEHDRARGDFKKALEINPKDAISDLLRRLTYSGDPDDYNKALETNPKDVEAYRNRGNAYYSKGKYDRAIDDFNKALEINPKDAEAYRNRGNAYHSKGKYDQAIDDFNKALEINTRDAESYINKALACERVGRKREALEAYKTFIQCATHQDSYRIKIVQQQIMLLEILLSQKGGRKHE